jgi:hydrogenase maturation protease
MKSTGPATVGTARSLVLGLGNPILKDDAVGILVAREVARVLDTMDCTDTEIIETSGAGFDVLDLLQGFHRAVVIDAIRTQGGQPGMVYRLVPDQLPTTDRLTGTHEINLPTALALGRRLGFLMPAQVTIFAIEVEDDRTFGETLSPAVAHAIPRAAHCVLRELRLSR